MSIFKQKVKVHNAKTQDIDFNICLKQQLILTKCRMYIIFLTVSLDTHSEEQKNIQFLKIHLDCYEKVVFFKLFLFKCYSQGSSFTLPTSSSHSDELSRFQFL